ncbi:MAG: ribosome biogenesis GTPase Der [Myxococcales bacterium]|nr:ribosome biogenesis GTPase Der [Myxococcales bacterium]
MTQPLVAIVGRPNVGKSTLFNRLAGKDRALVQAIPGVTRDLNYADIRFEKKRFTLVDTGGLSTIHTDELTAEVNQQVDLAIDSADAIIFLLDGREGLTPEDEDITNRLRKVAKPVYWVVNKVDSGHLEELTYDFFRLGVEKLYSISAREKVGVHALFVEVTRDFPTEERAEEDREDEARPTRVAFVGVPNAGKSSAINRILGEKRLIVSELPGTTRDAIRVPFQLDGQEYELIDTAGLRRKSKVEYGVEKLTAIKALQALDDTDIAIIMHEADRPLTDQTLRIFSYAEERGRGIILVINKIDLVQGDKGWRERIKSDLGRRMVGLEWVPIIFSSAKTGEGFDELFRAVSIVRENQLRRLTTGPLNRCLEMAVAHHAAPMTHNRSVNFYYMTQVSIRPPTFIVFTNQPGSIHFAYRRYLLNRVREFAPFEGTPIRMLFRSRPKKGKAE